MRPDPHGHLDERALLAALDADADDGLPAPHAAHLAVCTPCWLELEALRRTRRAVRALPEAPASPDLFARAMASRAAGRRVALETTSSGRRLRDALPWAAPLLLAASVALAVAVPKFLPVLGGTADSATVAAAPTPDRGVPLPAAPSPLARLGVAATSGRWEYRVTTPRANGAPNLFTFSLERSELQWIAVSEAFNGGDWISLDSTWLAVDFRALRQIEYRYRDEPAASIAPHRTVEIRSTDMIIRERGLPPDTSPIGLTSPPQPQIIRGIAALRVQLMRETLHLRWTRRFTELEPMTRRGGLPAPRRATVIGQERITVPVGTWDCWVTEIHTGRAIEHWWVRKQDGVIIRIRDGAQTDRREMVLIRQAVR